MTLRCILLILSLFLVSFINGQTYRVFLHDKGEINHVTADYFDVPVNQEYLQTIQENVDSVLLISNWLNYVLISNHEFPDKIACLPFVSSIQTVEHPIQTNVAEKYKIPDDDEESRSLLTWQLDTMGYPFFQSSGVKANGITIAVLDAGFTGVDQSPYFKHLFSGNQIKATLDLIDGDSNVFHGSYHGSMVLSCMAGQKNDLVLGMATKANYILIRTEETLKESIADEDRWVIGVEKAFIMGADIINSSLGFTIPMHKKSDLNGESIISKAAQIASDKGMIIINAAGNEYESVWKSITIPADANAIITVGAIGRSGDRLSFSSVGPTADGRLKPELSVPGKCYMARGNELVISQGTSFAAPVLTGFVACLMELRGKQNVSRDTILKMGSLFPYFDYEYGYGIPQLENWDNQWSVVNNDTSIIKVFKPKYEFTISTGELQCDKIFYKIQDSNGRIKFYGSKRLVSAKRKKIKVPFKKAGPQQLHDKSFYHHPDDSDDWYFWMDGRVFKY